MKEENGEMSGIAMGQVGGKGSTFLRGDLLILEMSRRYRLLSNHQTENQAQKNNILVGICFLGYFFSSS